MKIDNDRKVAPFRRERRNVNNGGPCTIGIFQRDHVIATRQKFAVCRSVAQPGEQADRKAEPVKNAREELGFEPQHRIKGNVCYDQKNGGHCPPF